MKKSKDEESSVDSDSEEKDGPENKNTSAPLQDEQYKRTKVTLLMASLGALIVGIPSIFSMLFTILFSKLDEEQLVPLTTTSVPGLMITGAIAGGAIGNYLTKGKVHTAVVGAGSYLRHCCKSKHSESTKDPESTDAKSQRCFKFGG